MKFTYYTLVILLMSGLGVRSMTATSAFDQQGEKIIQEGYLPSSLVAMFVAKQLGAYGTEKNQIFNAKVVEKIYPQLKEALTKAGSHVRVVKVSFMDNSVAYGHLVSVQQMTPASRFDNTEEPRRDFRVTIELSAINNIPATTLQGTFFGTSWSGNWDTKGMLTVLFNLYDIVKYGEIKNITSQEIDKFLQENK